MNFKIKDIFIKIASGFLTAAIALASAAVPSFAEETDENQVQQNASQSEPEKNDEVSAPIITPKFSLPDDLKAAVINIGDMDSEKFSDNAAIKLDKLITYGLNGVYIYPYGKSSCFSTDVNKNGDKLQKTLSAAEKKGMKRFVYFDISKTLASCPEGADKNDYLVTEVHKFAIKYPCTGIILTGFYESNSNAAYEEYMANGSGIGYKNWLYDVVEYRFKIVSDVIHLTDNTIAVGIDASDVWANIATNEDGSQTGSSFEAYYDGHADTKGFILDGLCDFVSVDASGSLTDEVIPFDYVCGWWDAVASAAETPMYIIHHNEKIGTDESGWGVEDQLLRQLATADELDSYSGSVLFSPDALEENPMGTTDTLIKYFNEQINVEALFEDLVMTSPYYMNYSTSETSVAFMGTFDENFDVYFDDEKLSLNEAGNFYFEKPLEIGMNTFVISHKGKTLYYNIERTINVLKSIGSSIVEGKTVRVDGGNTISLLAVAYKGSTVTATVNGTTVKLYENSRSEDTDLNSSYASFTGKYVVPDGIVGEEQYLGNIEVYAEYAGYSRTYIGADVVVNAVKPPENNAQIEEEIPEDQSSFGTGEVVGKITAGVSEDEEVSFVRLNKDFAYIYDGNNTDSVNPPNCGQLPLGTLDYYSYGWDEYYVTTSGKRFLKEDAEIIDGVGLGANALVVNSIGNSAGDSFIQMNVEDRISFTVEPVGNEYYSGYDGDFYLDDFTAQYVYITFDNLTSVTALPSFENCSVFSAGEWKQVEIDGVPKFRLILKLRQPGVYAGNSAVYDEDGNLVFRFEILTNDISNMTIVIDPGHGKTEYEYDDPGAIGHIEEAGANLAVAKLLEQKLSALGVNVIRLKTESRFYDTMRRPYYARDYGCDMYISLHSNKAGTDTARGTECYYYTSYSQPLAKALSDSVSQYFSNNVYWDGADCNRGDLYSYMWTTKQQDFPSVLIEMGFVSNYEDAMALADPTHQDGIADALVDGIVRYLSRSGISSY